MNPNLSQCSLTTKCWIFTHLKRCSHHSSCKVITIKIETRYEYEFIYRHSHHSNITIVFTSQNVFFAAPNALSIRRNVSEFVLFYSKNDVQSLKTLSKRQYGIFLIIAMTYFLFSFQADRSLESRCQQRHLSFSSKSFQNLQ